MLGAKFFDDQYYNNAYYGKVGGVPPKEINQLETEFLFMVNFNLFVTSEQYEQYDRELKSHNLQGCADCLAGQGNQKKKFCFFGFFECIAMSYRNGHPCPL